VFPKTLVQTCIVHLIRYSMHFASWKERGRVALALKPIFQPLAGRRGRLGLETLGRPPSQ
jgi:transposase-like protein